MCTASETRPSELARSPYDTSTNMKPKFNSKYKKRLRASGFVQMRLAMPFIQRQAAALACGRWLHMASATAIAALRQLLLRLMVVHQIERCRGPDLTRK
mmetsp:Transcript_27355/g.76045  ORF Transcript_27355/g.76045 Transcript_27355/m.76045 type:complete len:99 (+) Transcript_27355:957-1253(+)